MTWWEVLLAFVFAPIGLYATWFLIDCYWHGDFYVPDSPK